MDNIFCFCVRKSNVWRVILDINTDHCYQSHVIVNFYQIIMGIIDKNYLNRINQKIQNDLKNQPCGCDCNCRPKFEDDGTPVVCNCRIDVPSAIVGDWTDGRGALNTGQLFLDVIGGQNCPITIEFLWHNDNFTNATVTLKTASQIIPMTVDTFYQITLNPGDWYTFVFTGSFQMFDQYLTVECNNITCAENYGQVGSYTLIGI